MFAELKAGVGGVVIVPVMTPVEDDSPAGLVAWSHDMLFVLPFNVAVAAWPVVHIMMLPCGTVGVPSEQAESTCALPGMWIPGEL
jgi:hypothetical protein